MKTFLFIAGLVVIGYFLYRWGKKALDKITYKISLASGVRDVLQGITGSISLIDVNLAVDNKNGFDIPVNSLYVELYYNGSLVAKSTVPQGKFIIPQSGNITVKHSVTIAVTDATFNVIRQYLGGSSIEFTYKIKGNAFYIPFGYKGKFKT